MSQGVERQSCLPKTAWPPTSCVFELMYSSPRGPWLVIYSLYYFSLCLELCCDIFPWDPDLDRTHLRAWLVYDWIGGVTSWYQSRLPVGIPLSNSLAEVESSHCKTFTNLAVCLTGPLLHWVVLGSFIPRPILWDSDLSSIRVKMNLLTLTLGSRI